MNFISFIYVINIAFMAVYLINTIKAVAYYNYSDRNTYILLNLSTFTYILLFTLGLYNEYTEETLVLLGQSLFFTAVLIFSTYLSLLGNLLGLSKKILYRFKYFYRFMGALTLLAIFYSVLTGNNLILEYNRPPQIPFFLELNLGNKLLPLGYIITAMLMPVNLFVLCLIFRINYKKQRSKLITIGLIFSFVALLNDSLFAVNSFYYYLPLLGFVNIIEIAYASLLTEKRTQEKILRLHKKLNEKEMINQIAQKTIHELANTSAITHHRIMAIIKRSQKAKDEIDHEKMLTEALESANSNIEVLEKFRENINKKK